MESESIYDIRYKEYVDYRRCQYYIRIPYLKKVTIFDLARLPIPSRPCSGLYLSSEAQS